MPDCWRNSHHLLCFNHARPATQILTTAVTTLYNGNGWATVLLCLATLLGLALSNVYLQPCLGEASFSNHIRGATFSVRFGTSLECVSLPPYLVASAIKIERTHSLPSFSPFPCSWRPGRPSVPCSPCSWTMTRRT